MGSATLALSFFLIYRLPAFVTGDRPVTWGELDGDLAGVFGIYLWMLMMWGSTVLYREGVPIGRLGRGFFGMYVGAEALAYTADLLLTWVRHAVARLAQRAQSPFKNG